MEFLVARGEWIGLESIDGTLHGGVRSGIMATNYAPLSFGERPKGYLEDRRMKNNQKWYTQYFCKLCTYWHYFGWRYDAT
nr:hypothetical protein CE91St29_08880 [Corynebacterium striatum]